MLSDGSVKWTGHVLINLPGSDDCKRDLAPMFVAGLYSFFLDLVQAHRGLSRGSRLSSRIHMIAGSIAAFFLFSLYSGDLTAAMTAGTRLDTVGSLREVMERGYKLSIQGGTAQHNVFKHSRPGTPRHEALNSILQVRPDDASYFDSRPESEVYFASVFVSLSYPDFHFVQNFEDAMRGQLAFAFQKDSDIKPYFDHYAIKLKQAGIMDELESSWFRQDNPGDMSQRIFLEEPLVLGYANLLFPQIVLTSGVLFAVAAFVMERVGKHFDRTF